MKLLVIGATGRTGKELVNQALSLGHDIVIYTRNPDKLVVNDDIKVVVGEINDSKKIAQALIEVDAVLVTLGNPSSNKGAPLFEVAIPSIMKAMDKAGITRLINMSALGVGQTFKNAPIHYKIAAKTFLMSAFRDHNVGESQLQNSHLNWTIIYPGILKNGEMTDEPLVREAITGYKMPLNSSTYRSDVAKVMLSVLRDKTTYQKALIMCSKQGK